MIFEDGPDGLGVAASSVLAAYASMIDINLSADKWELNANVW